MKSILMVSLFAVALFALASCAPPANTNTATNANSNANAAPKAAAPTADSLMALDNKAFDAWKNKDGKFFEAFLADTFVGFGDDGKRPTRAEVVKMISEHKCELKSFALSEPHVTPAGADAAVLTYKATAEGTCEGNKIPSPVTVATVFVRSGDTWKAAYHNEVPIVEPPASSDAKASNAAAAGEEKKPASADVEKKEAPAANTATSNSNAAAPASSGDALTDALMVMERKGWDSWMKQDAAGLQSVTSKDITFVDVMGKATKGQTDAVKMWTDGSCKVSSVDVTDAKGAMITKDAAILTFKGTAVGTCGGMKLEPLWGTTVAVKEGDAWKAVYIFETPMRKS